MVGRSRPDPQRSRRLRGRRRRARGRSGGHHRLAAARPQGGGRRRERAGRQEGGRARDRLDPGQRRGGFRRFGLGDGRRGGGDIGGRGPLEGEVVDRRGARGRRSGGRGHARCRAGLRRGGGLLRRRLKDDVDTPRGGQRRQVKGHRRAVPAQHPRHLAPPAVRRRPAAPRSGGRRLPGAGGGTGNDRWRAGRLVAVHPQAQRGRGLTAAQLQAESRHRGGSPGVAGDPQAPVGDLRRWRQRRAVGLRAPPRARLDALHRTCCGLG